MLIGDFVVGVEMVCKLWKFVFVWYVYLCVGLFQRQVFQVCIVMNCLVGVDVLRVLVLVIGVCGWIVIFI